MYKFVSLFVVCFALSACGAFIPQIVGGRDAPIGKYPYQASIHYDGEHSCGASIIDKRYLLTAAHCVFLSNLKVHVGTNFLNESGTIYHVEEIIAHKEFNMFTGQNDIALLRVAKDIEFNDKVQPIPLATTNFVADGELAVLTGWGKLSANGRIPNNLQEIDLKIVSQERCKEHHVLVTQTHICTLTKAGEGACNGDSGGPLVVKGVQVGIVSFGHPCARGFPDVYTRVFSFQKWINENKK